MKLFYILLSVICLETSAMASWTTPVTLSSYANQAANPVVAVSATGYAIAVWSEYNGHRAKIRSSIRSGDSEWSNPFDISLKRENAFHPDIAMNDAGNAVIVWESHDNNSSSIRVRLKTFGGRWSETFTISDPCANASNPKATMDEFGNIVIAWENYDHQHDNVSIHAIKRTYYGSWSAPHRISFDEYGFDPQVASNTNEAIVVWTGYDGQNTLRIEASTLLDDYWTYPITLSDCAFDALNPQLSLSESGDATVVWSGYNGLNFTAQSSVRTSNNWSAPMQLSASGEDAYYPKVAADWWGNAVVLWIRNDGDNFVLESSSLYVNYSATPDSIYWTEPVRLSVAGEDAANLSVAVDQSGNAVAVWTQLNDSNFVLKAASLPFGGLWSAPTNISDHSLEAITPQVVLDENGNAIIVWAEKYNFYVVQTSDGNNLF